MPKKLLGSNRLSHYLLQQHASSIRARGPGFDGSYPHSTAVQDPCSGMRTAAVKHGGTDPNLLELLHIVEDILATLCDFLVLDEQELYDIIKRVELG